MGYSQRVCKESDTTEHTSSGLTTAERGVILKTGLELDWQGSPGLYLL